MTGDKAEQLKSEVERYKKEKSETRRCPETGGRVPTSTSARTRSLHQHHRWAQATTALQISIAMAAIALLTRRTWLQYAMYGVAGIGGALAILALLHI
jgi:hypothetical protein